MRARGALRWGLWFVTLAALCVLAWWRVGGVAVQTNVLALLPTQADTPVLEAAEQRSRQGFSQQILALVSGPQEAATRRAALAAHAQLRAAHLTDSGAATAIDQALSLYRRHSFALLPRAQIARYRKQGGKALATDVAVALASPAGLANLGNDPGGYAARFLAHLPRPYPDFEPDGPLLSAQRGARQVYLLRMQLPGAAYGKSGSEGALVAVHAAADAVQDACATCRFQATGAALFAAAARHQARAEAITLSVTSTLLIMLLIAWAYRSLAPHLLGFLQLGASVAAAVAAVIAVFGSIHILTLVFGTTLLGIAIDYAFLYFSEYWFGPSPPWGVLRKVGPGLGVGLATGVLAFACLALTGFPALAQMAVFSAAGLIEAALVVALLFPLCLTRPPRVAEHALVRWPARFVARARRPSRWRWLLPLLALLVAAPGWWQLQARDDVRELSHFPSQLLHTDQAVRNALGRFPASGFFLIEAPDMGCALAREASLFSAIEQRLPDADALGLSRFVPPPARQQASLAAWRDVFAAPQKLRQAFAATGLPAALADHVADGWQTASRQPLTVNELVQAVPAAGHFVVPNAQGAALLATLFGPKDLDNTVLADVARAAPGVRYVQPLARIDATFSRIRVRATWLVLLGYLAIAGILVWRYRWREALRMLLPPVLALALTLGTLGWLGVPLNVFSVVALILILGLGRDYAIFLREVGAEQRSTALAVLLSALTTIIGFGLLAFSATPALHAFGLTTGIGILASWLVAPLSLPARSDASSGEESAP